MEPLFLWFEHSWLGTSVNNSQASVVAKTTTLQHTFNKTGTFTVTLRARNSEETNVDRISLAQTTLTIPVLATRVAPGAITFDLQILSGEAVLRSDGAPAWLQVEVP